MSGAPIECPGVDRAEAALAALAYAGDHANGAGKPYDRPIGMLIGSNTAPVDAVARVQQSGVAWRAS